MGVTGTQFGGIDWHKWLDGGGILAPGKEKDD